MAITNDINNALVNSMYIVANDVVDKTAFDRTLTCFIKSVESAADGIYIVQSDTAQFTAYAADGARYYKNETVYVQVPQGDTSNKKFILGRVSDDEVAETNFQMMMPFDNLIKVHELPNSQVYAANQHGFRANKGREFVAYNDEATGENVYVVESEDFVPDTNITIFEYIRPTDTDTEDDTFMGMTKIGLVMDWQTLLGDYAPVSGTYGITIEIVGTTKSVDDMPEIPNVHYKTQFFSNEMYGNPYAYSYPTEQQKVIDISQFRNIDSITVKFWQDMDFVDGLYNAIPYRENFPPNILISNLHLWVGLAGSEQNEEFVYLFTRGSTRYTPMVQQEGTERDFTLHLNWIHDSTILKSTGDLEAYNVDLGIELGGETAPIHYSPEGKLIGGNSVSRTAYSNRELKTQWYYYDPESHDEISLETYGSEYVGPYWKKIENSQNLFDLNILEFINPELHSQERFCVAVFYDGKKAVSNTITYKNIEDVENQIKEYIANEEVILKIYREEPTEEGSEIVLDTNASAGRFLVYDENNQVLSDTHGRKYSDIQYYVQIFKRQEDGSYAPLAYETDPFTAAWNYDTLEGRRYTMFREFTTIIDEETLMKFDGYLADPTHHEMFSAITRGFKIKDTFDVENQVNDLAAVVSENGKIFYAHKVFSFGQSGTMGSKYTASIVVQSNARAAGPEGYNEANAYIVNRNVFKLDCQVYDKDNQLVETPYKVKWKIVNDVELDWVGETFDWAGLDPNNLPTELVESTDFYYKEDGGNSAYGRINISDSEANNTAIVHAPIVEATISGLPEQDYDLTVRRGLMTVMYNDMVGINAAQYVQTHQIICPDRIEFKSDGSIPYYYNREFEVIELTNKNELYKKTYPVWELINPIANLKLQATAHDLRAVTSEGAVTLDLAYNTYKLVCDTSQDTSLVYWKDEYLQKTPELRIIVNDAVYVYQPIVLAQNQYASSLVNQWDNGTLTLDEENGAMLGRMIAAGTKNNINQFTGIMMGDWSPKADESLNETGLYGYENGQQSFGFKSDGTAFIGKEGAGRIEFDGNTAMIKGRAIGAVDENNKLQTDREFYINLNPRVLNQSTETPYDPKADNSNPNFVFCKIPKMSIVSAAGHSGQFVDDAGELYINNEWAKQYLDDTAHDYFVVDPNNGLVLSGCVFANAGYIGKWLLKDGGLFWRSSASHSLNDFYKSFYESSEWQNLTSTKVFDIIYFGEAESSPFNKLNVLDHKDYILSAGLYSQFNPIFNFNDIKNNDDEEFRDSKYLLNYGVTAEGFLYSRYGRIGGWNIDNYKLYSDGEGVILDSQGRIRLGDTIELDGRDPNNPAIRLNPKRDSGESADAKIELAQFEIRNHTSQDVLSMSQDTGTYNTTVYMDQTAGADPTEVTVTEDYNVANFDFTSADGTSDAEINAYLDSISPRPTPLSLFKTIYQWNTTNKKYDSQVCAIDFYVLIAVLNGSDTISIDGQTFTINTSTFNANKEASLKAAYEDTILENESGTLSLTAESSAAHAALDRYYTALYQIAYDYSETKYKILQRELFSNNFIDGETHYLIVRNGEHLEYYTIPKQTSYQRTTYYNGTDPIPSSVDLTGIDNANILKSLSNYAQEFQLDPNNTALDFIHINDYNVGTIETPLIKQTQSGVSIVAGTLVTTEARDTNGQTIQIDSNNHLLRSYVTYQGTGRLDNLEFEPARTLHPDFITESNADHQYILDGTYQINTHHYIDGNGVHQKQYYVVIYRQDYKDKIIDRIQEIDGVNYKLTLSNDTSTNSPNAATSITTASVAQRLQITDQFGRTRNITKYNDLKQTSSNGKKTITVAKEGYTLCQLKLATNSSTALNQVVAGDNGYNNILYIAYSSDTIQTIEDALAYIEVQQSMKEKSAQPAVIFMPISADTAIVDSLKNGQTVLQTQKASNGYLYGWNIVDCPNINADRGTFNQLNSKALYENGKQVATKEYVLNLISGIEQKLQIIYNLKGQGGGGSRGGGGGSGVGGNAAIIFTVKESAGSAGMLKYTFFNGVAGSSSGNVLGSVNVASSTHSHIFLFATALNIRTWKLNSVTSSDQTFIFNLNHTHIINASENGSVLSFKCNTSSD